MAYVRGDLSSTRRAAAMFLDNLRDIWRTGDQQIWVGRWKAIGDAHCFLVELDIKKGAFDEATEAWLCALTAFEVARRLLDEDDPQGEVVSTKIDIGIQKFGLSLAQKLERVQIECADRVGLPAYYLPAGSRASIVPAVICISKEQETETKLLGRLLPMAITRGMSFLVLSHDEVSSYSRPDVLLSHCLDYLSVQPGIDATRIGVYGEGLSAVLATDFAASDGRIAAAVCDGGLWNWARLLASVGWMTRTAAVADADLVSGHRSRLIRRLKCPVLVVAGGRGFVSESEAIKLKTDCIAWGVDIELVTARTTQTPVAEIENFVTSDDCIFGWLARKLAHDSAPNRPRPRCR
ncbi:hypothetical protein [Bradyrhizobium diversitatis]|uniref:Dienelactone hydrolase domain-containing protein n=1 Tax=Bradyrhizobium diversitatis TaxID=2755406 RepID=A0ABS0PEZ0_9BRAD|nr:hypothetical protein [Bradyrhizobium diversitatis]MBH5391871.1 hypothetical protein [Bradyrhizobium diversitatis]